LEVFLLLDGGLILFFFGYAGACGRAGESKHALQLFQSMKDEGISADQIAYNTLFSALRVAGDADKVRGQQSVAL
jgi:pentatricopeptide repeat protein